MSRRMKQLDFGLGPAILLAYPELTKGTTRGAFEAMPVHFWLRENGFVPHAAAEKGGAK